MDILTSYLSTIGIEPAYLAHMAVGQHKVLYTQLPPATNYFRLWQILRTTLTNIGYWPVLLPDQDALSHVSTTASSLDPVFLDTSHLLELAQATNVDTWLTTRRFAYADSDPDFRATLTQPVPPLTPAPHHYSPLTYDFRVPSTAPWSLALVPTSQSWHVPLYLQFGGVNNNPYPVDHATLLRSWQAQYGAEIVCLTHDSLALTVTHVPPNAEIAWQLAVDQVTYCRDLAQLVDVETLATALLTSTAWFFWWD